MVKFVWHEALGVDCISGIASWRACASCHSARSGCRCGVCHYVHLLDLSSSFLSQGCVPVTFELSEAYGSLRSKAGFQAISFFGFKASGYGWSQLHTKACTCRLQCCRLFSDRPSLERKVIRASGACDKLQTEYVCICHANQEPGKVACGLSLRCPLLQGERHSQPWQTRPNHVRAYHLESVPFWAPLGVLSACSIDIQASR